MDSNLVAKSIRRASKPVCLPCPYRAAGGTGEDGLAAARLPLPRADPGGVVAPYQRMHAGEREELGDWRSVGAEDIDVRPVSREDQRICRSREPIAHRPFR